MLLRRPPLALLLASLVALACASSGPRSATAPPAPTAALPDSIRWVASSAEYAAATWQAYALAGRRVEELAAGHAAGTWAVVLDVDETVLSNVAFESASYADDAATHAAAWQAAQSRGDATAIPGAARFCARVRELGGKVVLVTNREEQQRAATAANLRRESIPFDVLILRPNGGASDKAPRWHAVEEGTAVPGWGPLAVLMFVGDNIKDFPGGDQAWRQQGDDALRAFGDRFIAIPNPMYGSWKPADPPPTPGTGGKG